MLKNLLGASVAVAALAMTGSPAFALNIQELDFAEKTGEHEIHVGYDKSQNNWTAATSQPASFKLDWRLKVHSLNAIDPSKSYVRLSVLGTEEAQGEYTLQETRSNPGVSYPTITWSDLKTFNIPGNKLLLAPTAVARCQQIHAEGGRPNQSHRVYIGQIASRLKAQVDNFSNVTFSKNEEKTVFSELYAVCDKDPSWNAPNTVVFDHGEFKVNGIELFLTTYSGATTQPNPATTCKKGRVLVRLKASKAGNAKFKLWTKVGGGAMTSKVIDAWAYHDGNGGFKAEHTEWVSVDTTTLVQAMAEEQVSTDGFNKSTQWKNITLPCSDQGGSGLTTQHDEPMAPPRTLKGDFTFVDHGAPKCAREGKALISFSSNQPGDVDYTLDCTNGQNFSGTAKLVKNPSGGFVAAALKSFNVASSTVYSCALKSSAPGEAKLHQWKSHNYKCETPAIVPPVGGLQVAPKPSQEAREDAARAKAIEDARARQQAEAAIQARLKAAQDAAEAKRRQEALIAAQRTKAALEAQRINALKMQQAAQQRRASAPVGVVPQPGMQRPVLRPR